MWFYKMKNRAKIRSFIVILGLLCTNLLFVSGASFQNSDQLDQIQSEYSGHDGLISNWKDWGQSFKPSFAILSRVKLYLKDFSSSENIILSIREDRDGDDLTLVEKDTSLIPDSTYSWIEFDFPDIEVEEGKTYFMVCRFSARDTIYWAASSDNPYNEGKAYYNTLNDTNGWEAWENDLPFPYSFDLCFKTFGSEHRPEKPSRPEGPSQVRKGQQVTFKSMTTDLDGDRIRYGWDFDDDDQVDTWTSFYPSNKTIMINHSWNEKDVFLIKVIAEDEKGFQSKWSPSMSVSVAKEKTKTEQNIFWLFWDQIQSKSVFHSFLKMVNDLLDDVV